ncbi:MAG: hypothetical protein M0Z47_10745 [Actinomycetota bacterium]|nr:hypothetical protein [Actinomycetota bacterium]
MAILTSAQSAAAPAPKATSGSEQTQLGPLLIQSQGCPVRRVFRAPGAYGFYAQCAVTVTNNGQSDLVVLSLEETDTLPDSGLASSPPGAFSVDMDGYIGVLKPGQTMTLASPRANYRGWAFSAINPGAVKRYLILAEAGAAVLGAGTFVIGYLVGRRRRR